MNNINSSPPQIFEWVDPAKTGAIGWVVIDSLVNGLAGGGIFIHSEATLEEVSDLAKTMSLKNTLLDPILGGAKAGIRFNHRDPKAPDIVRRFLFDHKVLLENCWTTGADLNIRNDFVIDVLEHDLKLPTAFYSVAKMLNRRFVIPFQSASLRERLSIAVGENFTLQTAATGYSVAMAIKLLTPKLKPRVIIQGWGVVGSSLSYFLNHHQIATIVGISDIDGFIYHPEGISENLTKNANQEGWLLSDSEKRKYNWSPRYEGESDERFLCRFLSCQVAEVFSPCAIRYQITNEVADILLNQTFRETNKTERFIISGANNPFRSDSVRILLEQEGVHVLPEWVSNSGATILFTETMKEIPSTATWRDHVFSVIQTQLETFLDKSIVGDNKGKKSLYEHCHTLARQKLKTAKTLAMKPELVN